MCCKLILDGCNVAMARACSLLVLLLCNDVVLPLFAGSGEQVSKELCGLHLKVSVLKSYKELQ
jgi:hypothetical protein